MDDHTSEDNGFTIRGAANSLTMLRDLLSEVESSATELGADAGPSAHKSACPQPQMPTQASLDAWPIDTTTPQERAHHPENTVRRKRMRAEDLWPEETTTSHSGAQNDPHTLGGRSESSGSDKIGSPDTAIRKTTLLAQRNHLAEPYPVRVTREAQRLQSTNTCEQRPRFTPLQHASRRQYDRSEDDQDYKKLLDFRRKEKANSIDRYVLESPRPNVRRSMSIEDAHEAEVFSPISTRDSSVNATEAEVHPRTSNYTAPSGLLELPEAALDKILSLLLVRQDAITVDYLWLINTFVSVHTTIPATNRTVTVEDRGHILPLPEAVVMASINRLQSNLLAAGSRLLDHAARLKALKSPTRGLTMAPLLVCRSMHERAARIFYSQNTFCFPSTTNAWITLQAFLVTITTLNVSHIRHLRIHAPLWHPGIQHDAVAGAIMDALSPATRLAILKPPAPDRLLAAVSNSVDILHKSGSLESLELMLNYPDAAKSWIGKHKSVRFALLPLIDAEAQVERKVHGIAWLKRLSDMLGPEKTPVLTVCNDGPVKKQVMQVFRGYCLTSIIREAEKYGWLVDQTLRELDSKRRL